LFCEFCLACCLLNWYLLGWYCCYCSLEVLLSSKSFVFLSVYLDFDPFSLSVLVNTQSSSSFPVWNVKSIRCWGLAWCFILYMASLLAFGVFTCDFFKPDLGTYCLLLASWVPVGGFLSFLSLRLPYAEVFGLASLESLSFT